ncbi:ABC transporter permease [Streptomyces sp. SAS_270]|uniref:ABC transporter permease n=1 Tax=Streptomyces sp. SAS_270 TaxID=3412748 RepID=UPI00403C0A33
MLKIRHDPRQLVDSAAIPILFTNLCGGAISSSTSDYLRILLPAVVTMSIAIVTMYGDARLAQDVRSEAFDRFRGLPVWRGAFVLGGLLSDAGRARRGRPGHRLRALAVPAVGRGRLAVRDPAVVISIANSVLMPLSFASNVFVQPSTVPGWLRAFVDVNPLSHVPGAARG